MYRNCSRFAINHWNDDAHSNTEESPSKDLSANPTNEQPRAQAKSSDKSPEEDLAGSGPRREGTARGPFQRREIFLGPIQPR